MNAVNSQGRTQLGAIRARLDTLDAVTAAFLCWLDAHAKRTFDGCDAYLRRRAPGIGESEHFLDAALWLWVLGEYADASGRTEALREHADAVRNAVAAIGRGWNRPCPHWLVPESRGIHLVNLAMAYGGLRAADRHFQDEEARRLLREIREFVFSHMLHEGRTVGTLGSRESAGDAGVAAVPFGLFNAGDLVLVAAVDWLEGHLADGGGVRFSLNDTRYGGCARPDLTALLAWYYTERGDLARAAELLEAVRRLGEREGKLPEYDTATARVPQYARHDLESCGPPRESDLAWIVLGIAEWNLERKSAGSAADGAGLRIVHRPAGTRSPYVREAAERFPREPEEGDAVTVHMQTVPYRPSQKAVVQVAADGADWDRAASVPMEPGVAEDGTRIWRAEIGKFAFGSRVAYRFVVTEGETTTVSDTYSFQVRGWWPLQPAALCARADRVELVFQPLKGMEARGVRPRVTLDTPGGRLLRCVFDLASEADLPAGAAGASEKEAVLAAGRWRLAVDAAGGHLRLTDEQSRIILQTYDHGGTSPFEALTDGDGRVHKLRLNLRMEPGERMYGTGERYADLEFSGRTVDHHVFNQYRDQGMRTYMPVPLAISSKGYGLYLHTGTYSEFRFGSRLGDRFEAEAELVPDRPIWNCTSSRASRPKCLRLTPT